MFLGSDFDRRLAFLILDVGVETLIKTVLSLPESVSGAKTSMTARNNAIQGNFHGLIQGLREALPVQAEKYDLNHVQFYHNIRNTLYHEGTTVATVRDDQLRGYTALAVEMLREFLKVDLSESMVLGIKETKLQINYDDLVESAWKFAKSSGQLISTFAKAASSDVNDPVVDSVETELASGRYRLERLSSQAIRIFSLDNGNLVDPVKPFLRNIIVEKSLDVSLLLKSGSEKNTRLLGKEVIKALKPSAWHGWVDGQKIRRDTLITALIGRIREGEANEGKWSTVDYIRNIKDDVLVFHSTGRGYGNSPFNLRCWETVDGKPIKKD